MGYIVPTTPHAGLTRYIGNMTRVIDNFWKVARKQVHTCCYLYVFSSNKHGHIQGGYTQSV